MWRFLSRNDIPQFLDSLDLPGIAKYIKSDSCKNVFVMAGAGISTSAGIPDFRSPDTGLYANLARLNLPYPEAVFDINFFKRNPRPFYVLANELAPGKFRPTLAHSFIRLLAKKGLLHTCFTQNIDTLERAAGVPADKIIEAHGSFANQHCVKCGASYPHDKIKKKIAEQEIPICERRECRGYVKPDIVFFGENLPLEFSTGVTRLKDADLLIVMGTSLTVHPFASLTEVVPEECPRLLLNLDHVGGWGSRANDIACLMPCDDAVRELCKLLGWEEELEALWLETDPARKTKENVIIHEDSSETKVDKTQEEEAKDAGKDDEAEKKAEPDEEGNDGKDAEEKDKDKTAKEPTVRDQKQINEELLANVVDKLAETIGEVRLEDELSSNPKERLDQPTTLEERSREGKIDVSGLDESPGNLDKRHESEGDSTKEHQVTEQTEGSPSSETVSGNNHSTTGKL